MKNKKENIESLFREGFSDYHPEPSAESWQKLSRKLLLRNFMRFNPSSFNIFYTGIFVALVITGITFLHPITQKNKPQIHELKTNNQTQNPEPGTINTEQRTKNTKSPANHNTPGNTKSTNNARPLKSAESLQDSSNSDVRTHDAGAHAVQTPYRASVPVRTGNSLSLPIALFTPEHSTSCAPCQIHFKNNSLNAKSWEWSFGDGGSSQAENPAYIYDEPGTYYVTLTAVGEDNSICTHTEEIIIHPAPEVNFNMDINGKPGEGQPVYFYNYSRGAENYFWDFGDGGTSDLRDPSWLYNKAGDYNIKLKAVSEYGCADSMIIENAFAEKSPEIIFPNVFSPNLNGPTGGYYSRGESNNDVFHPYTAEEPVEYQLRIFNRHGNLIFESNDLHKGWDGYFKEKLQPQGVYVWKIRGKYGNGESFVRMGDLTLLHRE
jgi:gliding motility-associated-like protein